MPMPITLDTTKKDFCSQFSRFINAQREVVEDVDKIVSKILFDVAERGDSALLHYTKKFDRLELNASGMRFTEAEIIDARGQCSKSAISALFVAAERIREFHLRQIPKGYQFKDSVGVELGMRWTPISAAGIYVPGGTAAYPSSVLMNGIPAKVAGVERIAMIVPTPDGEINPLVLAAADIAGISEIYRVGGAQGVGALAYGTETIDPVDKITGPGNAFVASAKRQVFGRVGIDMIAGPSEILIVADSDNDPDWIAADLLSQAEHDENAQSVLITNSSDTAQAVMKSIDNQLAFLDREDIARKSWNENGVIIIAKTWDEVPELVDRIAPEHLELAVKKPELLAEKIRHAGAIFLGRHTPEAIGDYVAGPNHVLPTARSARFSSGLGAIDFMKRTTLVRCDPKSIQEIGPAACTLAEAEGLDAHARSVSLRLRSEGKARA